MGRMSDQLCAACDASFYKSYPGQSLSLFILTLLGGLPAVDTCIRLDSAMAAIAHVRSTIEQLVQAQTMPESSLVGGLIRAIDDILVDCSNEMPKGPSGWSPATERLVRHGVLVESDGELRVNGESEMPAPDRVKLARADLDLWRELTAMILEEWDLTQTIGRELEETED